MNISYFEVDYSAFISSAITLPKESKIVHYLSREENSDGLLDTVLYEHPEIQLALWDTQVFQRDSSSIIYATNPNHDDSEIINYCEILTRFFKRVDRVILDNKLYSYWLKQLRLKAVDSYYRLKADNMLNPYINMLESSYIFIFDKPFAMYKYIAGEGAEVSSDAFFDYIQKVRLCNDYISLPIGGFSKEEIISIPTIKALIQNIGTLYVLFSCGLSIAAYIVKE